MRASRHWGSRRGLAPVRGPARSTPDERSLGIAVDDLSSAEGLRDLDQRRVLHCESVAPFPRSGDRTGDQ